MTILALKLCLVFANGALQGDPGACVNARWSQTRYSNEVSCQEAQRNEIENGRVEYTYAGLFFNKLVTAQRVISAECRK